MIQYSEASTYIAYSQSIDTCTITKTFSNYSKNLKICNIEIKNPICVENAKFELINVASKTILDEINGFQVRNCKIFYMPQLPQLAEKLKFISITSSKLQKVTQQNLQLLTELISLNLNGNEIKSLEKNLFKFNPKIKAVRLAGNPITFIEPGVFNSFESVEFLDFRSTKCYAKLIDTADSAEMSQFLNKLTSWCNKRITEVTTIFEGCEKVTESNIYPHNLISMFHILQNSHTMTLVILNLIVIIVNLIVSLVTLITYF